MIVNVTEAKNNMSKLTRLLQKGEEKEIIVCNRGTPMVRWVAISPSYESSRPFGLYKEKYPQSEKEDFFALDEEIAKEFAEP